MSETTQKEQSLSSKPAFQIVDEFPIPVGFSAENFSSGLKYKPRDDDIFLVTYPKCGTTWANEMLMLILRHGELIHSPVEFRKATPFLDNMGAKAAEEMPRPGVIKSHVPFRLIPWSDRAKYICIARNPKDCCVSYFYHISERPDHGFNGTFDDFFEFFLSEEIAFGDYFEHLLGWYEHRNDPNVLFMTYEEMKENTKASILKMASFIDDKLYAEPLRRDSEKLNNVIKNSSFQNMKERMEKDEKIMSNMSKEEILSSDMPSVMKKRLLLRNYPEKRNVPKPNPSGLLRKGIIGDWKNYFSEDQDKRMNKTFADRTKGTDIPKLWENYM